MRLLVFAVVGMMLFLLAYGFNLGGTQAVLIFLLVFFIGAVDKVATPLRQALQR